MVSFIDDFFEIDELVIHDDAILEVHPFISGAFLFIAVVVYLFAPHFGPEFIEGGVEYISFFINGHFLYDVHEVYFIIYGIFTANEVDEAEGIFSPNHEIFAFVGIFVIPENDETDADDWIFALVEEVSISAAIIAEVIIGVTGEEHFFVNFEL